MKKEKKCKACEKDLIDCNCENSCKCCGENGECNCTKEQCKECQECLEHCECEKDDLENGSNKDIDTNTKDDETGTDGCSCDKKHCVSKEEFAKVSNDYVRALADYINLKKRTDEDRINLVKFANEVLLEKVIGIFNDLEEAKKHIDDKGLEKVIEKFKKTLDNEGIEQIDPEGKKFDPSTMEAIESTKGEKDKVIRVYRKGYKLQDKVIITAMVAVGDGS